MQSKPKWLLVKIHMLDGQPAAEIGNCTEIKMPNGSKRNPNCIDATKSSASQFLFAADLILAFASPQGKHCDDWIPLQPLKEAPVKKIAWADFPQAYENNFNHIRGIPYNNIVFLALATKHQPTNEGPRWPPDCINIQEGKRESKFAVVYDANTCIHICI